MNHTDAHGAGEHRRCREALRGDQIDRNDHPLAPAQVRPELRSTEMYGMIHEQLARQRHREAYLEARQIRLWRAVRAQRKARRATEIAVRAAERVGADAGHSFTWAVAADH